MSDRPASARQVRAWCLYDWANSAFATTVMAGFFPVFFKGFCNAGVDPSISTARLGMGASLAGVCVALLSPVLGSLAGAGGARKRFLAAFMLLGVSMTAALAWLGPGQWMLAILLFLLADIGFSCGNLFYDSLLTDVAPRERMDRVSSQGYAAGYLGGGLLFAVNVLMVQKPGWFHLASPVQAVKASFLSVALWWLLFSVPLFLWVQEARVPSAAGAGEVIRQGLSRLRATAGRIIRDRPLLLFFLAYWLYIDGVYTVIAMSVDFGLSIGLPSSSLVAALLLVQFVAFPAALLFGVLAERTGALRAILGGIGVYALVCGAGAFWLQRPWQFFVLAAAIGAAQGGVQALSRSWFAKMVPAGSAGEFFGFFNLVGKFSMMFGPLLVGGTVWICHSAGAASGLAARLGMSSVILLFVAGGGLLIAADRERRRAPVQP